MSVWKFFLYSIHGGPMRASVPKFKSQLSRHFHNKNYGPDSTEHAALQFYNIAGFTFFSPMNMVQQNILFFLLHSLSRIFAFALFSFHSIRLFSSIPVIYGTHKHDTSFFNIFRNFFSFPFQWFTRAGYILNKWIKINASKRWLIVSEPTLVFYIEIETDPLIIPWKLTALRKNQTKCSFSDDQKSPLLNSETSKIVQPDRSSQWEKKTKSL